MKIPILWISAENGLWQVNLNDKSSSWQSGKHPILDLLFHEQTLYAMVSNDVMVLKSGQLELLDYSQPSSITAFKFISSLKMQGN